MVETVERVRRRRLRFESYDEIIAEVQSLSSLPTQQLGNWSLGQVCQHLGVAMEQCTCAEELFPVPWRMKILGRMVRGRLLKKGLPRGFQLPPEGAILLPPPVSSEEGLATLERGIAALAASDRRVAHPVFGAMNKQQWTQFHLRHAEMHLSFIVPSANAAG